MKLKTLSTAMILATVPMTGAFAAALDRSGQSISAFLQPGNYFEAGISVLDPSVSGKIKGTNISVGEMADDYQFYNTALKLQLTPNFSFGLIYDQPFGAAVTYPTGQGAPLFWDPTGTTKAEVETQNLSLILGFQPTENWNIYGGGVYQTVKGNVELHGAAYSGSLLAPTANFSGYKENIGEDSAAGWLAGVAYQIPEIALKASLTYRSEIEHSVVVQESSTSSTAGIAGLINLNNGKGSTDITTPQSVNLDFQTGIMADTVAFANIRWVEWSKFAIRPYAFGKASVAAGASPTINKPNGFDLLAYTDDQISATVGVGRKLSEKWAGTVAVGYDTGAGNPVSTLGPTEGYWNVGLGLQFSPAPNYFIAGGVKYFMLGDAKAQSGAQFNTPAYVADFNDNDAWAYGLKIGYKF